MEVAADPFAFPRRRVKDAVLVRPPRRLVSHRLVRFRGDSLLYPRGALIARLGDLTAVSIHLGLKRSERVDHARQLLDVIGRDDPRIVIGGDLNAHPDDPAVAAISGVYPDVWAAGEGEGLTMPAARPTARIDGMFAGAALTPVRAWTVGGTASDHLMVVVDLETDP